VDPLPDDSRSEPNDDDLPMVSDVREIENARGTVPGNKPASGSSRENDPEASFIKALRETAQAPRGIVGDVTAVRAAPQLPARLGGRIVVLEGPDEGGEADIAVMPSLIGRASAAEIGLTDPTISRRHVELRHRSSGEGYVLIDLGSTSGTLVNGVIADGEVGLRHGDVISLGKTTLRFFRGDKRPGPRPERAPREPSALHEPTGERSRTKDGAEPAAASALGPREPTRPHTVVPVVDPSILRARVRRTTARVIRACAGILVVAVVAKWMHGRFVSDASPAQIRSQVAELLADGRNRLRAQDVDGASASAQTVLALNKDNEEAHSLLTMAATETASRDAVALALRLGDDDRDVEAGQILQRIPDASVFAPTRDRLRRTLDERGMLRSRRTIEALLDEGRLNEALAVAEKHVSAYKNDDVGSSLLERVLTARKNAPRRPGLDEARAAFASGDTARAKAIARANGLDGYAADVAQFERALAKGKDALSRFEGDAAESLDDAFRLLAPLGASASSPIFADVRKPYGKALFLSGTGKLDDKKARCAGARELHRAGRVLGEDGAIRQKLRDLEQMALGGLERARAAKAQDGDRASAIAREHVCLARPGTATYDDLRRLSRL
jgi:hypothetical protein